MARPCICSEDLIVFDLLHIYPFHSICVVRNIPHPADQLYAANEIYDALLTDKKRRGGNISVILPRAIGDCMLYDMPVEDLKELLQKVI